MTNDTSMAPAMIQGMQGREGRRFWFMTSQDKGATWQLTDGPFTIQETLKIKAGMDRPWVIVQMHSLEGLS